MRVFFRDVYHEHRSYRTSADRRRAMKLLWRRGRVCTDYQDVKGEFALMIPLRRTK